MTRINWQASLDLSVAAAQRAVPYVRAGRVRLETVETFHGGAAIVTGHVQGTQRQPYAVHVEIYAEPTGAVRVDGACSCPVATNCKHVAAVLLAWQSRWGAVPAKHGQSAASSGVQPGEITLESTPISGAWREIITDFRTYAGADARPANVRQRLVYVLFLQDRPRGQRVVVQTRAVSVLKSGHWGKSEKPYAAGNALRGQTAKFVTAEDAEILRTLATSAAQADGPCSWSGGIYGDGPYPLDGPTAQWLLARMRATGRLYWSDIHSASALEAGPELSAASQWAATPGGDQRYTLVPENAAAADGDAKLVVLPVDPLHYVDLDRRRLGRLRPDLPDRFAAKLLAAPALAPAEAAVLRHELKKANVSLPAEPAAPESREARAVRPEPVLELTTGYLAPGGGGWRARAAFENLDRPVTVARLAFRYDAARVRADDPEPDLEWLDGSTLVTARRDPARERALLDEIPGLGLSEVALTGAAGAYAAAPRAYTFLTEHAREDAAAWLRFVHRRVPALRRAGWSVDFGADFPYAVSEPDGPVQVEIATDGDNDWFGLGLGVEVDGERVDLQQIMPAVLAHLAAEGQAATKAGAAADDPDAAPAEQLTYVHIGDGRYLALPSARLGWIARALHGLFERHETDAATDALPVTHLGELAELDAAADNGDIAVTGGAEIRALATALSDGGGVRATPPPAGLSGVLRGYQQRGLDWLQSLAGHGLGGILADDMGLGKTLQALAHVLAEKKQGRLDRPCLLVAPTSVVWTWRNEARRFAPDLETLVLHGTDRKAHFEEIPASDLVITTYALLPRDAARLRAQAWHLVICDEAQALKNPDAQAAHVLRQMTRRQLVCLSGTPVENHLEELWSLTQLAVPGLLGDRKTFRRVYRTPIEKHGDDTRRAALARRLRPFLLRRTKDQVAGELPPRTETIEHVQLTGAQRDLYETVRTAMDKRVRAEIAKHGLARSQIMVLDALLKLRQVCCDPRLLKMDAAQGITESAKLERLMSMLADLTAEGRQVLVFSQFSSMLDLIAQALDAAGHAYVSLTGQTRDRETPVRRFQAGEVPIFLISLKAGGTGLTLTAADTVIHYDPWWNPAAEAQAADRAHRIGQDKPVFVYRLIAEGTVEDRIVDMQARKRDLASLVQDADGMTGPALDAQDIDTLLAPVDAAAEP